MRKLPIGNSTGYFTRYIEIVREICNSTARVVIVQLENAHAPAIDLSNTVVLVESSIEKCIYKQRYTISM